MLDPGIRRSCSSLAVSLRHGIIESATVTGCDEGWMLYFRVIAQMLRAVR
jgi:hypothetical protein